MNKNVKRIVTIILVVLSVYLGYNDFVIIKGELFKSKIEYIYTEEINLSKLDLSNYSIRYEPLLTIDFVDKGGGSTGQLKLEGTNQLKEITYAFPNKTIIETGEPGVYDFLIIIFENKKYYLEKKKI